MLIINYKGITPQNRYYSLGVKQNNNADRIRFILDVLQEDIDLSDCQAYLKVQNKEHTYIDKIMLTAYFDNDNVQLDWVLTRKSTQFRNLELQIEFKNSDDDVVWQTLIVELELNDTIKADEEISERYPTELEQLETKVEGYDDRIENLEQNALVKSDIVDNLESNESDKVLSAKQGKALNDKINNVISNVYTPQGSISVASLNALDTTQLENGWVYDMLDSGVITLGNIPVNEGDNVAWIISNGVGHWDILSGFVDLSNYTTKNNPETITANWLFTGNAKMTKIQDRGGYNAIDLDFTTHTDLYFYRHLKPNDTNTYDLGASSYYWKDLYLSNSIQFNSGAESETTWSIQKDGTNQLGIYSGTTKMYNIQGGAIYTLNTNGSNLGRSSNPFTDLYLKGKATFTTSNGNNFIENGTFRLNLDSNGKVVVGQNNNEIKFYDSNIRINSTILRPQSDNTTDLGTTSYRFKDLYLSGVISNGTNSVAVADICKKGQTLVASGTFTSGEFTISTSLLTDGMYFLTYGNCQAFLYISSTMLASSNQSPIRTPMVVVYDSQGNARIGTLGIQDIGGTAHFKLFDNQGNPVYDNYTMYIFKTNLA